MKASKRAPWTGSVLLLLVCGCSPEMATPPVPSGAPAATSPATAPAAPVAAAQPGQAAASGAPAALPHGGPAQPAPRGWTDLARGEALNAAALPLTDVLAKAEQLDGQVVRTNGTVDHTCPGGCWVMIGHGLPGGPIRVKLATAELKTPPDCQGAVIDVQGVLHRERLSLEKARHFEEERAALANEKPKEILVEPLEVVLQATGWKLDRTPAQAAAVGELPVPPCMRHKQQADDLLGEPHPAHRPQH
ncbi:MAG: hypothetical protein FJ125_15540 [Deltaproteobacteria bacterium]|nr:hypothetical protein [Deltaproteobacteria bacterium]